jgi:hypothetical protein
VLRRSTPAAGSSRQIASRATPGSSGSRRTAGTGRRGGRWRCEPCPARTRSPAAAATGFPGCARAGPCRGRGSPTADVDQPHVRLDGGGALDGPGVRDGCCCGRRWPARSRSAVREAARGSPDVREHSPTERRHGLDSDPRRGEPLSG